MLMICGPRINTGWVNKSSSDKIVKSYTSKEDGLIVMLGKGTKT